MSNVIHEVQLEDVERKHVFTLVRSMTEEEYWDTLEPYYDEITAIEYDLGVLDANGWPAKGFEGWGTDTDTEDEFNKIVERLSFIFERAGLIRKDV